MKYGTALELDVMALLGVSSRSGAWLAKALDVKIGTIRHVIVSLNRKGHSIWMSNGQYGLGSRRGSPEARLNLTDTQRDALQLLLTFNPVQVPRRIVYQLRKLGWSIIAQRGLGYRLV